MNCVILILFGTWRSAVQVCPPDNLLIQDISSFFLILDSFQIPCQLYELECFHYIQSIIY